MPSVSFQARVSILTGLQIYFLCIWSLLDVYSLKGAKCQWHLWSLQRSAEQAVTVPPWSTNRHPRARSPLICIVFERSGPVGRLVGLIVTSFLIIHLPETRTMFTETCISAMMGGPVQSLWSNTVQWNFLRWWNALYLCHWMCSYSSHGATEHSKCG